jgi:outer membrane protein TolC
MSRLRLFHHSTFVTQIFEMMKTRFLIILFTVFFGAVSFAQENSKHLKMEEAIAAAVANNDAVKLASLDEQMASTRYQQTNAVYLPQVGVTYTAFSTNNPLNAFGFKLQQKSITQADFNPALLNHPSGTPDFTTKLELQQPIINADMFYQRKAAAKQIEFYQLSSKRTKEYISFETQKAYLQLQLAYDGKKVLEQALQTAKAVQQSAENYFNQGIIQKSDVLNAKVHVGNVETQLTSAKSNIANASDYLSVLMGRPLGAIYTIDEPLQLDKTLVDTVNVLPASRADLKAMEKAMEGYDLMIKSSQKSYLPRLNAFGSYQLNDSRMLGFGAGAYLVGIQLSWDIFKGNRTKNTIALQNLEKKKIAQQLEQEKSNGQSAISQAKRKLDESGYLIKQQTLAIEQSDEALRVLQNRYAQGLVTTNDVLMSQTQLSQQKLNYAQAIFEHNLSVLYLQFLTATNNK